MKKEPKMIKEINDVFDWIVKFFHPKKDSILKKDIEKMIEERIRMWEKIDNFTDKVDELKWILFKINKI